MSTLILKNARGEKVRIVPQNNYYLVEFQNGVMEMSLHDLLINIEKSWKDLIPVSGDMQEWAFLYRYLYS